MFYQKLKQTRATHSFVSFLIKTFLLVLYPLLNVLPLMNHNQWRIQDLPWLCQTLGGGTLTYYLAKFC